MVTIPLAPRTARAIDLAIGERTDGPMFPTHDGQRLDRHGAGRIVRKVARRAGIGKAVTPHTLRHAFITAARRPVSRLTCRPENHDAVRPGPGQPGPARHLRRRRVYRGCRPRTTVRRAVTDRDRNTSANRPMSAGLGIMGVCVAGYR